MYDGVSFVCPFCISLCGWHEKKQLYDAVEIRTDQPRIKQYAHTRCAAEKQAEIVDEP